MPLSEEEKTGPRRVLVVVAHPDDAEFSVAGTVALWAREGQQITYVICTDGSRGTSDPRLTPQELNAIRVEEQRRASKVLGVQEVVFLSYTDGQLVPSIDLRRDLTRMIRRYRPDAMICQDPTARWVGQEYINHPDHIAAGEAALAAVFPTARDRLSFPELLVEGLEPHKVSEVYVSGTSQPDTWVEISSTIDVKIRALREHRSQISGEGIDQRIREWAQRNAQAREGLEFAETFKYFKLR